MQAEKAIEVEHCFAGNIDARPHGVILRLAVRHYNVQSIGRPALKNYDQAFSPRSCLGRTHGGASQKAWHGRGADDCERAVTKKNSTSDGHAQLLTTFSETPAIPAINPRSH